MGKRVLVVEDDLDALDRITTLLETSGFQVTSARSMKRGLTLLSENRPEILILDHDLPDGTGAGILENLPHELQDTPTLILTSHCDPELVQDLFDKGADSFVTKTESNSSILRAVESLSRSPKD